MLPLIDVKAKNKTEKQVPAFTKLIFQQNKQTNKQREMTKDCENSTEEKIRVK